MAKHEIVIRENTGATKAVAPYLALRVPPVRCPE